jgi:hypothetical protein
MSEKTLLESQLQSQNAIQSKIDNLRSQGRSKQRWFYDRWLLATVIIACCTSIIAVWYFAQNYQILLLGDTYAHMLIARRLFDNSTPGLAQLGGIWLPLPHLLMVPFIWNDYLWHTGLAGSFVSMPCYIISAIYIFLAARRLTRNSCASFAGTLVFIFNPNILYLQSTPLSELVLIATMTIACYYFLAWAQEDNLKYLIQGALGTFLATLARYDAWPLFIAFVIFIVIVGLMRKHSRARIEANLITFSFIGGLGIVLWLLWGEVIFGDPLYFQHSPFSSQAQQQGLIRQHYLFTYHNLWQSIRTYSLDSALNVGAILLALATIALIVFFIRRRIMPEKIAITAFLVPFAFYVLSLYTGQAALFIPGASPAHAPSSMLFYNTRYGIEMLAPVAMLSATLVSWRSLRKGQLILQAGLVAIVIMQSVLTVNGGIVSLQSGQYGLDCAPLHPTVVYLAQHYDGGRILSDTFTSGTNALGLEVGVDFKNVVYEGSGDLWTQALANPTAVVDWIEVNPRNSYDSVAKHINLKSPLFLSQFTLAVQEDSGLSLYHRNGLSPLPTNALPPGLLTEHRFCGTNLIPKLIPCQAPYGLGSCDFYKIWSERLLTWLHKNSEWLLTWLHKNLV